MDFTDQQLDMLAGVLNSRAMEQDSLLRPLLPEATPAERHERIAALAKLGHPYKRIAGVVGLHPDTCSAIAREHGVRRHWQNEHRAQEAEVLALRLEDGRTFKEIEQLTGLSRSVVRTICRRAYRTT